MLMMLYALWRLVQLGLLFQTMGAVNLTIALLRYANANLFYFVFIPFLLPHSLTQIDALSEVVASLHGKVPVFVDGGFRTGTDIFKALALGADMVFVGRPVIYGLTVGVRLFSVVFGFCMIISFDRDNKEYNIFWAFCAPNWIMQ